MFDKNSSLFVQASWALWAFLGGAVAGATVVFLTSPRSGAENRKALREAGGNAVAGIKRLPKVVRES